MITEYIAGVGIGVVIFVLAAFICVWLASLLGRPDET